MRSTPANIDPAAFPREGTPAEQIEFLLGYAVLAPSSHNTQPWIFDVNGDRLEIYVDQDRWLQVADHDQRELFISIGCALENLVVAARHFDLKTEIRYLPSGPPIGSPDLCAAEVRFARGTGEDPLRPDELFGAIPKRRTDRRAYRSELLEAELLDELRECVAEEGVRIRLVEDERIHAEVQELVRRADVEQFADPAWRKELAHWIGRGAFGTPWLVSKAAALVVAHLNLGRSMAKKDLALLESTPILGVVTVDAPTRERQIQAGQAFERLFLMANVQGLSLHPMNQALQLPHLAEDLGDVLRQVEGAPQLLFRLGRPASGSDPAPTPRRPPFR